MNRTILSTGGTLGLSVLARSSILEVGEQVVQWFELAMAQKVLMGDVLAKQLQ